MENQFQSHRFLTILKTSAFRDICTIPCTSEIIAFYHLKQNNERTSSNILVVHS